jgi:hypothetical protein
MQIIDLIERMELSQFVILCLLLAALSSIAYLFLKLSLSKKDWIDYDMDDPETKLFFDNIDNPNHLKKVTDDDDAYRNKVREMLPKN